MVFLRKLEVRDAQVGTYPLNKRALLGMEMALPSDVTILVGDNGSGKSTLLEAMARKLELPAIGERDAVQDDSLKKLDALARLMKLTFARKPLRGFFLRSEDFFGFTRRMNALRAEMLAELARIDIEYEGRSDHARGLARMPFVGSLHEMESRYGVDLDAGSHGESFLKLFQARIVPGGLYLMDEPEVPLSPIRQMSLISLIREQQEQSQFIIATHSPILMAYPGAHIINLDGDKPTPAAYDELEHVSVMREFLKSPERFLRHL